MKTDNQQPASVDEAKGQGTLAPATGSASRFKPGDSVNHLGTKWVVWDTNAGGFVMLHDLFGDVEVIHQKYLTKIQ